jgi:hypothetical protein
MPKPIATFQLDSTDYNYIVQRLLTKMPRRLQDKGAKKALGAAAMVFKHKHLRPALNYRDHTLKSLEKLGHPYARRHGSIKTHQANPWVIHKRSGAVLRSVKTKLVKDGTKGWASHVYSDTASAAPHVKYVFSGTKNMLPRAPFKALAKNKKVKTDVENIIIAALLEELRKV